MASQDRWDAIWLNLAINVAENSTCARAKTGAVIASASNQVLSVGYNGAPRGAQHCSATGVGCLIDKGGHCVRTIHSEMNAILQAARVGTELYGAKLYSTHRPCYRCTTAIIQTGIGQILFHQSYDTDGAADEAMKLLKRSSVQVRGPVKEVGN